MSRIGNAPITVPNQVAISVEKSTVNVVGPKGELCLSIPSGIGVTQSDGTVRIVRKGADGAMHGLLRAQLANALIGVTKGWTKTLELSGVGYRAVMAGADVTIAIGFSHPVTVKPPAGITFTIQENTIVVSGTDKQLVGQVAAGIRAIKKPEPYKGKGIKYAGEHIRKKAGKAAKAIGGAPGAAGK
ncbi:50S ribosomal protein L6 [Candidatus Gottesmanbacteria bacterium]|nr:50S ribosomal protein L6 [Candidatus Gottesmanbacteria bacterium]